MSSDGIITVVLVDDHAVVRAGLKAVLGSAKDIKVIGEGSNGQDAISLAKRLDPDVIVMDLSMGEMDGGEATKELVANKTRGKILILTMHAEDSYLVPLLEAGASGYLVKSAADRELIDAVRAVAHGDVYMQPSAARALAQRIQRKAEPGVLIGLRVASVSQTLRCGRDTRPPFIPSPMGTSGSTTNHRSLSYGAPCFFRPPFFVTGASALPSIDESLSFSSCSLSQVS